MKCMADNYSCVNRDQLADDWRFSRLRILSDLTDRFALCLSSSSIVLLVVIVNVTMLMSCRTDDICDVTLL